MEHTWREEKCVQNFSQPEVKQPLGRPKQTSEDSVTMYLTECEDVTRIHLTLDRVWWWVLLNTVINLWVS
jgi:hypothetical protein